MGCFTWTFCNKPMKKLLCGDYSLSCKLHYDGAGGIYCPDGTVIWEPMYEGYGVFDGHDAYDLVTEWNRAQLKELFDKLGAYPLESKLSEFVQKYSDEQVKAILEGSLNVDGADELRNALGAHFSMNYFVNDWKRHLGIELTHGCAKPGAVELPYPLKIVSTKHPKLAYSEYPASISCQ